MDRQQPYTPWVEAPTGLTVPPRQLPAAHVNQLSNPRLLEQQRGMAQLAVGAAGFLLAGYHGYRRNDSYLWGLLWGLGGFTCPVVTIPIAISQGYANPLKG